MSNEFMNAYRATLGWIGFTMALSVIVVVVRLLGSSERSVWIKLIAGYAALAACIIGFVIVFAALFAPR